MDRASTKRRVFVQVPTKLALMSPTDLEVYVRAHWNEWKDGWRQVGSDHGLDDLLRIDAGEPVYLIERGGRHYLVTEGTKIVFDAAA